MDKNRNEKLHATLPMEWGDGLEFSARYSTEDRTMPPIDLLISTMNYRPGALDKLLATVPNFVNVIVVNQMTDASEFEAPLHIRPNVRCYSFREAGLSRSRNRLMSLATGEVFVICDDDIEFIPGAFDEIAKTFAEEKSQDVLTFMALEPDGTRRKPYKTHSYQHNKFTIAKVTSFEIAARKRSISEHNIKFDESFGLGANYPMGEEVIFLRDCIKAGLKIRFMPIAINVHPEESTGRKFSIASERSRGAVFYRLYGRLSYLLGVGFYFRKRFAVAASIGYGGAVRAYLQGIHEYKNYRKQACADRFVCRHTD